MKKIMFNDKYGLTQAVLEGRKTQTRRILRPHTVQELRNGNDYQEVIRLYSGYKVGEVVAVAQKYKDITLEMPVNFDPELTKQPGWTNKMFTKADILTRHIRITNIRIERLQYISDEDCMKEGIWRDDNVGLEGTTYWYHGLANSSFRTPQDAYVSLIDRISGKGTWASNPYMFVYDFVLIN